MKNRFDQRVWGSDPCKYGNVAYIVHGEIYVLGAPWKETYTSKNAKCDWTRTAMSSSILLSPFRILGSTLLSPGDFEHYPLKEILAFTTFCRRFFRSLRHARLTWIKLAFGVNLLLHPLGVILKPCGPLGGEGGFMKSPHKSTRGEGGYWCCPRGPNILSFLGAFFQY